MHRHDQNGQSPQHVNKQEQQENVNVDNGRESLAHSSQDKVKLYQKERNIVTSTSTTEAEESPNAYALVKSVTTHLMRDNEYEPYANKMGINEKTVNDGQSTSIQTLDLENKISPQRRLLKKNNPIKLKYDGDKKTCKSQSVVHSYELGSADISDSICSIHNSNGTLSLRETLQQLPSSATIYKHRKIFRPLSQLRQSTEADTSLHHGIIDFVNDDIKKVSTKFVEINETKSNTSRKRQSLFDPTISQTPHLTHSRSSLEKSPRRKRSKSESKRRRERKLIAAGEMEVRQANESLMHYMKQCSAINDTTLSGELEIDKSIEERKIYLKSNFQRVKSGHIGNGLSSILNELTENYTKTDDKEIYNPFTPVTSPTDNTLRHIDKLFIQTSSGYRPIEHSCYCKDYLKKVHDFDKNLIKKEDLNSHNNGISGRCNSKNDGTANTNFASCFNHDTCYLLTDGVCHGYDITSNIELACLIQKFWQLVANICHGLLAGLGLAQLILILSCNSIDWSKVLQLANETFESTEQPQMQIQKVQHQKKLASGMQNMNMSLFVNKNVTSTYEYKADNMTFANIYINTFYCLCIICTLSILDRVDICRWSFRSTSELVSFRWLITFMLHIATMILTICSYTLDEKLYFMNSPHITAVTEALVLKGFLSLWSSICLYRSVSVICSWCIIGITQQRGVLFDHLLDLTSYHVNSN